MRFFGSILLFQNCHFAQFLPNLGSEPKFERGKKLVITHGWLKVRSLCPNSATLRWHTNRILHIDPKCGIWKVRFFGSILLFKNCHFAQFLANLGLEQKFEGGKKLVITRGCLKMRRLCPNSATLRWHTNPILHIDPKCGIWKVRFFGSILLFKNCHFAHFLANLGSEPKFERGKKLVITHGWLKVRSLCPNSATLRWHTKHIPVVPHKAVAEVSRIGNV